MDTIGSRVKALRLRRDLKQGALAKLVGVTQSALSQIESGMTETLRGEVLAGLCRELRAPPDYIMWGTGRAWDQETIMLMAELSRLMQTMTTRALFVLLQRAREYVAIDSPVAELVALKLPGDGAIPHQATEVSNESAKRSRRPAQDKRPGRVGKRARTEGRPATKPAKGKKSG